MKQNEWAVTFLLMHAFCQPLSRQIVALTSRILKWDRNEKMLYGICLLYHSHELMDHLISAPCLQVSLVTVES